MTGSIPDTYVIYIGDNGTPMYGRPNLDFIENLYITRKARGKGTTYESGARVPLAIRGPGIAGGRSNGEFVDAVDLFPTILTLAGLTPPTQVSNGDGSGKLQVDGVSLAPILQGKASTVRDPNQGYLMTESLNLMTNSTRQVAARNATYKVMCTEKVEPGSCEFYNLARDPLEEFPLDKPASCDARGTPAEPRWHYCRLAGLLRTESSSPRVADSSSRTGIHHVLIHVPADPGIPRDLPRREFQRRRRAAGCLAASHQQHHPHAGVAARRGAVRAAPRRILRADPRRHCLPRQLAAVRCPVRGHRSRHALRRRKPRPLRVFIGAHLLEDYIRPLLPEFYEEHPQQQMNFLPEKTRDQIIQEISSDKVDVAVITVPPDERPKGSMLVGTVLTGVYGVRSYRGPFTAEEISALPFVLPAADSQLTSSMLRQMERYGVRPTRIVGFFPYHDLRVRLACRGKGVLFAAQSVIDKHDLRGQLRPLFPMEPWSGACTSARAWNRPPLLRWPASSPAHSSVHGGA